MTTSGIPELPGLADLSPLGQGGLADVYLARQIHLERWVAAKVFRVTLDDEQAADRFRAECRALGRLDQYPNIITVYDAGVLADGRPYLISERCDGSLTDLVSVRGPLPADRICELGLAMARALRYAHSAGVLHGDVTPSNVLLRSSGAPVLADFGLAVLRENRTATAAGFTQAHAAPETLGDSRAIDERSDVYGLGSTLHTALTGQAPFPREPGEDDPEHVDRIRTEPVPEPAGPAPLTGLIVAMLAKDPALRPGTDEIVDRLAGITDGGETQAMRLPGAATAGWSDPGDAAARTARIAGTTERTRLHESPQRTPAAVARPRRPRRGLVVGAIAGVLVLVGGIAAAAAWQASRDTPAAAPTAPATTSARPAPIPSSAPAPATSAPASSTAGSAPSASPRTGTPRRPTTRPPATPDRVQPRSSAPAAPAPTRTGPRSSAGPAPGQDTGGSGAAEPGPADPGARSGAGQRGPSGTGNSAPPPGARSRNAPAAVAPASSATGTGPATSSTTSR